MTYTFDARACYGEVIDHNLTKWSDWSATIHVIVNVVADSDVDPDANEDIKGMSIKFDLSSDSGITLTSESSIHLTSGSAIDVTSGSAIRFFPVGDDTEGNTENDEYTYYFVLTNVAKEDEIVNGFANGNGKDGIEIPTNGLTVGEIYSLKLDLVHNGEKIYLRTDLVTIVELN